MAGTIVEWYEFFLYATAATLVFGKLFFPDTGNDLDGIIAAFATYAIGFIARPLGGVIFGHFGDRMGRKALLQISLLIVGAATFLIGCLPTYEQIGYAAPILLVMLRFVQGLALGGEWGGAALLVTEQSPAHSRAFWGSFLQAAAPLGNLLATAVILVLAATISEDAFLAWGWRVGFWLSVVMLAIGYVIRTQVPEPEIFKAASPGQRGEPPRSGLTAIWRTGRRSLWTAMGLRFGENILYYMVVTFTITYLAYRGGQTRHILGLLFVAHIVHALAIPICGHLSDRIGRRPAYLAGAMAMMAWPFLAFPMLDEGEIRPALAAIIGGLLIHALMYATQPALMTEMFPTWMRYSGVSLGYQVTALVAGSWAPLIGTALLRSYDGWMPIAIYIAASGAVSLIAALCLRETKGVALSAIDDGFDPPASSGHAA
ncbi:MAG: MFS transporter [Sphingobium sp.]